MPAALWRRHILNGWLKPLTASGTSVWLRASTCRLTTVAILLPTTGWRWLPSTLPKNAEGCFSPHRCGQMTSRHDNANGFSGIQKTAVTVDSQPLHNADKSAVVSTVCEAVQKEGLGLLDWSDDVARLQKRVDAVAEWHPEMALPDLSTEHVLSTASEWLPFYIEQNGKVLTTAAELKKINLHDALWALIPYDMQQEVDRLAPSHITVPSGSRIRVDYRKAAEAPVLSVRLQECFGMLHTPCVDGGKRTVLMELLSPGFKPVQLTQDMDSFWSNAYFEVRKELKRRYPKHYWPENPLDAEAVRGVKRK